MRWLRPVSSVLLTLVLAGCPPPARYSVQRPPDECHRATRVAHRTMVELGYTVTEMTEAAPGSAGTVVGYKTGPDGKRERGRVVISCKDHGVDIQPVEDGAFPDFEFSRAFGYSYKSLVQRPDVESPTIESGLQVLIERIDPFESRLELGGNALEGDGVLVRITTRNATDRDVSLSAGDIELMAADGTAAVPLSSAAAAAVLAGGAAGDRVRQNLLDRLTVAGGQTAVSFLVFPEGTYRDAMVSVEDVETGETEGFMARVQ